jgi:YVTN family beta-propeller protein
VNAVYVADKGTALSPGHTITVIDGWTEEYSRIEVGTSPNAITIDPAVGKIFVANTGSNTVTVIDEASRSVLATVAVGSHPQAMAANAITGTIYVANALSNNISVIDGGTNTVVATIPAGVIPDGAVANPVTGQVYVISLGTHDVPGTILVLDSSDKVLTTLSPGISPCGSAAIAVNAVTNRYYVANLWGNTVTVIDGSSQHETEDTGDDEWIRALQQEDAAGCLSGGDGVGGALERVVSAAHDAPALDKSQD